jgi:cell division septation protein DedD
VTQGNALASALASSLKSQGFPVRIVASSDRLVRVMVGPYSDQQSLDQAKAALASAGVTVIREW